MTKKDIAEQYKKLTPKEHILKRPETYVGSITTEKREIFTVDTLDIDNLKIVKKEIQYNSGFIKIFDEILTNASDHVIRTGKVKNIKVDVMDDHITVWNDGPSIPIQVHPKEKVYVPELIFAHLLTSENYDDTQQRFVGGRNGYGAKLTNIFSTKFIIEVADGKKKYKQTFKNNLETTKSGKFPKPKISESKTQKTFTKITFYPDLEKFGLDSITEELKETLLKRVIDISAYNPKVTIKFNKKTIPVKSFKDYIKLFIDNESDIIYERINDHWEIGVVRSPFEDFEQVSMVNGISTIEGGSHVNHVTNAIVNKLKTSLSRGSDYKIAPRDIKSKLLLFLNSRIGNPEFHTQTKEKLTSRLTVNDIGDVDVSDNFIRKIARSDISQEIKDHIELKHKLKLKKETNSKKKKYLNVKKLDDANKAGSKESENCLLFLTEGDSALSTCLSGFAVTGRDYYGAFPLKGKPLNVREVSLKKINSNDEIKNIISALGLEFGKKYKDTSSLRYGKVVIMTDQDHDGSHIKGLLINMFDSFWEELLEMDFIYEFVTPIVKASKGNKVKYFYKLNDYKRWKSQVNISGWFIKYYKGLGTILPSEAKEFFKDLDKHLIKFNYRDKEKTKDIIDMVFDKKRADDRKEWLANYEPDKEVDKFGELTHFDSFFNDEFIEYSMADNIRSIPNVVDGMKPTNRKILHTLFKKNFKNEIKVSQLSGSIIESAAYHHGPMSLEQGIIRMAQDFVGSNNINLLEPKGQFGTRLSGGKDSSASRYIFSKLSDITKAIFKKEDNPVLSYNDDDGYSIEPKLYMPIIPMVLVNGADGVGTGWSTQVPKYNINDLIAYIEKRISGVNPRKTLEPYYRGFKGKIFFKDDKYISQGVFERIGANKITITELPIGMWNERFYSILDKKTENDDITGYIKHSTDTDVNVIIKIPKIQLDEMTDEDIINMFSLEGDIYVNNMNLFNSNGKIDNYQDIYQIIDEFIKVRLEYYKKRKEYILDSYKKDIDYITNKINFIKHYIDGNIVINNKTKKQVEEQIKKLKLDLHEGSYDYLLNMSIFSLSKEKQQELKNKLHEKKQLLKKLEKEPVENIWKDDLSQLKKELKKVNI